ncbi:SGNH/GDSL hydrolase family protein [Pseudomonas luteola]|uniref:SGNH/GDSL hydrolase family protein n=1 Tax=Pseudomonas luteola TaxID=47886 RepID=UPI003A8C178E
MGLLPWASDCHLRDRGHGLADHGAITMPITFKGNAMGGAAAPAVAAPTRSYKPYSRNASIFGDSRAFLCHSGSNSGSGTGNNFVKGYGIAHHIAAHSQGAVHFPWALQGGVAGDTTEQALDRLPAHLEKLKAAGCNLMFIIIGTNDRTGGQIDLGTTKRNVMEIVQDTEAAGITPVLLNDFPRGTGSSGYELTDALAAEHYAYSRWVLNEMSKTCHVINTYDSWLDPASGTKYRPYANAVRDGIHPSKIGGQLAGRVAGPVAAQIASNVGDILQSNTLFNADSNPMGSLTPNPLCLLTGGSLDASVNPAAGSQISQGWAAEGSNMTGLVTTWSKEVDANGMEWQKVRITGTAGATAPNFNAYVNVTLSNLSDNDKLKASGLIRYKGKGLSNVGLGMLITPTWTVKMDSDDPDTSLPWPSDSFGVISRETPELIYLSSDSLTLIRPRVDITLQPNVAVDATIWFTKTGAFKIDY